MSSDGSEREDYPKSKEEQTSREHAGQRETSLVPSKPHNAEVRVNDAALVARFLANQGKEIELRAQEHELRSKELDLRGKSNDQQHEFALKSLDAQAKALADEHRHKTQRGGRRIWLAGVAITLFVGLSGYALHLGKEEIVKDVFKIGIGFAAGLVGGYGYAKSQPDKGKGEADESDD